MTRIDESGGVPGALPHEDNAGAGAGAGDEHTPSSAGGGGGAGDNSVLSDSELESRRALLRMELATGGTNISGGFAQSVALARVFLRTDAQLIILDESLGQVLQPLAFVCVCV